MPRFTPRFALLALILVSASLALGATPDEMAKSCNTTIRSAENAFFKGELDEAATLLEQGKVELDALKAAAPDHKQVKNLQNKYDRLKDRLDKKLEAASAETKEEPKGRTSRMRPSVGGLKGAAKAATGGAVPATKALTSGAKSTLSSAERAMDQANDRLEMARESLAAGDLERCQSRIGATENYLADADAMLDRARRSYKLDENHPDAGATFRQRQELADEVAALTADMEGRKNAAATAGAQAAANKKSLDDQWLPRIKPFIDYDGATRIQGPNTNDASALAAQDAVVAQAEAVLAEYNGTGAAGSAGSELKNAAEKLRFNLECYHNDRRSGMGNKTGYIERDLAEWEGRLAANASWKEDSGTSLYIVRPKKISHVEEQIADLASISPADAEALTARLTAIKTSNDVWTAKREAWDARPRPLPAAKMTSQKLEGEMVALMKDRGWSVDRLVITDKDWWVQSGEYRYMAAAVLSSDGDGAFWSTVSFKQDATLAGYAALEVWEIGDKVRLP